MYSLYSKVPKLPVSDFQTETYSECILLQVWSDNHLNSWNCLKENYLKKQKNKNKKNKDNLRQETGEAL